MTDQTSPVSETLRAELSHAICRPNDTNGVVTLSKQLDAVVAIFERFAHAQCSREADLVREIARLRAGLQKIVDFKDPLPRAAVREACAELLAPSDTSTVQPATDDTADAARYRHLKEHASYYYAEGYDPPTPREFGINWDHQDCTPDRPGMDWLIDQEIEAKRIEALEDAAEESALLDSSPVGDSQ